MTSPSISIITAVIPVAFRLDIEKMTQLIAHASNNNIKVVLVHDIHQGSLNESFRELKKLENSHNLQIIEGHYNSPGAARNAGFAVVKSEWITFWDADDQPYLEEISKLMNYSELTNCNLIIGNFTSLNAKNLKLTLVEHNSSLEYVALNPGLWRIIFRRERICNLQFTKHLLGEDQLFFCNIGIRKDEVFFHNFPIYQYHTNSQGQLTSKKLNLVDLRNVFVSVTRLYTQAHDKEIKLQIAIVYYRLIFTWLKKSALVKFPVPRISILPKPRKYSALALWRISIYTLSRSGKP